jgi:hypothetical protein
MNKRSLPAYCRFLFMFGAIALVTGLVRGFSDQAQAPARARQLSTMSGKFPNAAKQPAFCTNCARLSVNIDSYQTGACPKCDDFKEYFGLIAYLNPDFWIANHGTLASNTGTLTVEWQDPRSATPSHQVWEVPSIPPGGETIVTPYITNTDAMLMKAGEGVTLTLDYSDANGTRHSVRRVTKCPDR